MKLTTTSQKSNSIKTDVLGILLLADDDVKSAVKTLPRKLQSEIIKLTKQTKFKGKTKQILEISTHGQIPAFLIVLIGLGNAKNADYRLIDKIREASALLTQSAKKYQASKVALSLSNKLIKIIDNKAIGQASAEGIILGSYQFTKYKRTPKKPESQITEATILTANQKISQGLKIGEIVAEGVCLARNLVNEPPGQMKPQDLVQVAKKIADQSKSISLKLFDKKQLVREKFGAILAVARGSIHEPYLIHLIYRPTRKSTKQIALIGKGITFDSGGLSLKPHDFMQNMKSDMAGAATVLGVFQTLDQLKPLVEVHGIFAACENMPGSNAIKPGDVIKIKNGASVEILNTDAEGRLILADTLSYAVKQKITQIIDLATLTGACIMALGNDIAGLMSNNKKLATDLRKAARETGEKIWRLPLESTYNDTLKSKVADLNNVSEMKGGGAITAGLFLKKFVGKTPWAHIDIAGPAYAEKQMNAYTPPGGVGFGVKTMIEFLIASF